METSTTTLEEQNGTFPTPSEYREKGPFIPTPSPHKFCVFLSIMSGYRVPCEWRECGSAHMCRGT